MEVNKRHNKWSYKSQLHRQILQLAIIRVLS
jgi:hypothetical protein